MTALRIAMLTHSTNPRGGVVHALELAEALQALGHEITLTAPSESGWQFFRNTACRTRILRIEHAAGNLKSRIGRLIDAYLRHFSRPGAERFDIYHAQDAISGCALAILAERGLIPGYLRTVHHLDRFADEDLAGWQRRSFVAAEQVLCVSDTWRSALKHEFGVDAVRVDNGVDCRRFGPIPKPRDAELRDRLGLAGGPVFLSVGGIEARKNTLRILEAFVQVQERLPEAQLVIAGGASLLDHRDYRKCFDEAVAASGLEAGAGRPLLIHGPLPDEDMPSLFRLADALVFPSLNEGFGLVVLEAIASGTPAVVSRIPPFTEYLNAEDCLWTDPLDASAIADAMLRTLSGFPADRLAPIAQRLCARFSWENSARRHLDIYRSLTTQRGIAHA